MNIVAGETIVPELVQNQVTADQLASAASRFLEDKSLQEKTRQMLSQVRGRLGTAGASGRVADAILAMT